MLRGFNVVSFVLLLQKHVHRRWECSLATFRTTGSRRVRPTTNRLDQSTAGACTPDKSTADSSYTSFIQNWTSFVSCGWRPFIQRYTFQVAVVLQLTRLLHYIIITKNPSTSIMRTKIFTDKKNDCFFPVTGVTFSHILLSCREMNNFNLFRREGLIFSITLSFCQYKLTLSSMATWLACCCWASVVCRWVL